MLLVVASILFFIVLFSTSFFWTYLWQLKEYRFDRLYVHIKDTLQGRRAILSEQTVILLLGFVFAFFGNFSENIAGYFPFVATLLLAVLTFRVLFFIYQRRQKRPVFTPKAVLIVVLSLFLCVVVSLMPLTDIYLWFFITLFITPLIISLVVFLFAFPTEIYTDIYIQKAKKKRSSLKNLHVIAVSGSYGKSSTKEIIAHVLSQKYSVVKTALSNNTPLAIAKTLLTKVDTNTDFFIVELGAYKKGEIRQLAEIVSPTISVTTAVSDQHLALYGEMKDVVESELELMKVMPHNALIILNENSDGMQDLFKKIKQPNIVWYSTKSNTKRKNTIVAQNITVSTKGITWEYRGNGGSFSLRSPLLGKHTVENILPAVFLGKKFGLRSNEIEQAVKSLRPLAKTMESKKILNGITIIDDTFNASPESVVAAIDYLKLSKKRKILVLSPLIELGKMSSIRHKEIGENVAGIDFLFITNKNYFSDIKDGIAGEKGKVKVVTGSYDFLAKQLVVLLRKDDAIVFEGKEAGIVLQKIQ